ncbi:MAG: hypothetical protein ACD_49C00067G0025 [uncultured bacterium (gcode 4)]|uniref:Uncharacterized protein n=1 Tax=uncultured bacterium (gcode 4) TaxID=1234023 RepID=K2BUX7_9BACT|nr:MAG: hypothetical protein ACD_49C00067G0025 [uncultured bacterium (gcode 4)]
MWEWPKLEAMPYIPKQQNYNTHIDFVEKKENKVNIPEETRNPEAITKEVWFDEVYPDFDKYSITMSSLPEKSKIDKATWNISLEMPPSLWITHTSVNNKPFDNKWVFEYKSWDLVVNIQSLKEPMPWKMDIYLISLENISWDFVDTTLIVENGPWVKISSITTQKRTKISENNK